MRPRLFVLAIVASALGGYAAGDRSLEAQTAPLVQVGDSLTLYYASGLVNCEVGGVSDDFVRCKDITGAGPVEHWHNLRTVQRLAKPTRR